MIMKLEIRDNNQNLIKEDNLEISNGDILIAQINQDTTFYEIKQFQEAVKGAFKEKSKHPNKMMGILVPKNITLKVLKIIEE